jgi:phage terminase small subunit
LNDCDEIVSEFTDCLDYVKTQAEFLAFSTDNDEDRLYSLFLHYMVPEFPNLWKAVSKLLLLSHGQASVERVFSVNKEAMDVNLCEESLIARRTVKDYIHSVQGLRNVRVTQDLITLAYHARNRYQIHLADKREVAEKQRKADKRKPIEDELEGMVRKKKRLELDEKNMVAESHKAMDRAESISDIGSVAKANALRRGASDKGKELQVVHAKIKEMETILSNM